MCPITESAKKALRQSLKRKKINLDYKKKIKNLLKKMKVLVSDKKIKEAEDLVPQIYKALDKAAKTGVIKKNTASRKKAEIVKFINKSKQ